MCINKVIVLFCNKTIIFNEVRRKFRYAQYLQDIVAQLCKRRTLYDKCVGLSEKCQRLYQSADRSADRQTWCQSTDECPGKTCMQNIMQKCIPMINLVCRCVLQPKYKRKDDIFSRASIHTTECHFLNKRALLLSF